MTPFNPTPPESFSLTLLTLLPGPTRKRTLHPYGYRLTYRSPDPAAAGCVMTWEILGGRLPYQIALERTDEGNLRAHCTCADAVYRAETTGRFCKHIQGLLDFARQGCEPLRQVQPPVAVCA